MSTLPGDSHHMGLTAIVTVGFQLLFFAIGYSCKFDKVTDLAGGMNFVLLALLTLGLEGQTTRQIVLSILVTVSRLELALFLLYRVIKRGKDDRFDDKRDNFFVFLAFWIFQMIWVWTVSLPVTFVNGEERVDPDIGGADIAGWVVFGLGFIIQVVSDIQKYHFRANPANRGKICDVGLWRYSRHPNYFGEIMLWWGVFIAATPVLHDSDEQWGWISVLSPVLTMVLLLLVSGIPTAEGPNQARYMEGPSRDAYITYRNRTPPVFLFIPALYQAMPLLLKRIICLELPMYEYKGDTASGDKSTSSRNQTERDSLMSAARAPTASSAAASSASPQPQTDIV